MFAKREQVYGPEMISVGDFDPTVDGFYRNVIPIPLDVKPKRKLRVKVTSDFPVDVVVANDKNATVGIMRGTTDIIMGPYDTGKMRSMGILVGLMKGDKAKVTVEAWTDKE